MALVVGTVVAFASGLAAIAGLLRLLRNHSTLIFIGYRIVLGVLLLVLLGTGVLQPKAGLENVSSDDAANTKNKQAKD
jgi:undecaprenyl-diphosphatase